MTRAGDRVVLNRGKVISETSKSLAEAAYTELMSQFGGRGARPVSVHHGSGMSREQAPVPMNEPVMIYK